MHTKGKDAALMNVAVCTGKERNQKEKLKAPKNLCVAPPRFSLSRALSLFEARLTRCHASHMAAASSSVRSPRCPATSSAKGHKKTTATHRAHSAVDPPHLIFPLLPSSSTMKLVLVAAVAVSLAHAAPPAPADVMKRMAARAIEDTGEKEKKEEGKPERER